MTDVGPIPHVLAGLVVLELSCPTCAKPVAVSATVSAVLTHRAGEAPVVKPRLSATPTPHVCGEVDLLDLIAEAERGR